MPRKDDAAPARKSTRMSSRVLEFPARVHTTDPQPPEPNGSDGPRRGPHFLDATRDDMTRRWYDKQTSITTIRRKLNVSIPRAEQMVRAGLRARFERKAS
jgi:hypothetical protein